MSNIQQKVIVITGARSGLGEAAARRLASEGARVIIGARRTDRIEILAAEINEEGGEALAVTTDGTDRAQVQPMIDTAVEAHGRVDVLINNAGIMSSVAGHRIFGGSAVYSATEFGVRALSEGRRQELAPHGFRTTIISPGAVKTGLLEHISEPDVQQANKEYVGQVGLSTDPFARVVAFAISRPRGRGHQRGAVPSHEPGAVDVTAGAEDLAATPGGRSASPTYDFTGQVAFVTGAAAGMGLATAKAYTQDPC